MHFKVSVYGDDLIALRFHNNLTILFLSVDLLLRSKAMEEISNLCSFAEKLNIILLQTRYYAGNLNAGRVVLKTNKKQWDR